MAESINELKSYTEYNVNTPTSVFTIGFQYDYNVDHVNVYVDGVEATAAGYTVQHDSQGTVTLTPAVPNGVVRLSRETNIDTSAHTFSAGAKFTAGNMDENFQQIRHSQQEVRDGFSKLSIDTYEIIDTLQDVGQAAQDAADAAEQAAQTANDAAAQVNDKVSYQDLDNAIAATPHNNLQNRDVAGAHPASAISYGSGSVRDFLDDQHELNELQAAINEANTARFTDTAYLVDFMTKVQYENWITNPESVDITPIYSAALTHLASNRVLNANTGNSGWGLGRIKLPRGQLWFKTSNVNKNSILGLIVEGSAPYATSIIYNSDDGVLFEYQTYSYLEFKNLSVIHKTTTVRSTWTNSLFKLNGAGGGQRFKLSRVTTQGFNKVVDFGHNVNEDTNVFEDCSFSKFNTFLYSRNPQAVVNNFNNCGWFGACDKVFDIVGFGHTTINNGNVVISGAFFSLTAASGQWGSTAVFGLDNVKFEYWNEATNNNQLGTTRIIETADSSNIVAYFKFKNCGIAGGTNGAATNTFDIKSPITVEIDGGGWGGARIGYKAFTITNIQNATWFKMRNLASAPLLPPVRAGDFVSGAIALPVIVEDSRNTSNMTYTSNTDALSIFNHIAIKAKHVNTLQSVGQILTGGTSRSHSMSTNTQRVGITSVVAYCSSNAANLTFNVYSDAAKTLLIGTANSAGHTGYQRVVIPINVNSNTAEGIYVDVSTPVGKVVRGFIEVETVSY